MPRPAPDESQLPVTVADCRLQPPDNMIECEIVEWKRITHSLPGDFFKAGDIPLLRAFCAASALYNEALDTIRKEGAIITSPTGVKKAHPAKDMLTSQAAILAMLAAKLRLCPSARMVPTKAASANNRGSKTPEDTGMKPWETLPDQSKGVEH